ncbi:nuclear transport factor 2 family protein [Neolewinella litorea]|uniref:Nuclear transport factor 2 family protein n=1 Tax=Neolewinella litorea TaxID=2562452 RepID=A0A4S4NG40_9BACT|nr:nuclear transport factor 2 family protein [Neolewinella litorea]THH37607.1 nuclear transport factor 2 family protein [Neolewinella litorea]
MKTPWRLSLCCLLITGLSTPLTAQDHREQEIRQFEDLERQSVLQRDTAALFGRLWSPHMVINTPANVVGTVEGTKQLLRNGGLDYLSFKRNIEKITFIDDVAIVMGGEVIRPQGQQPHAGKTVHRRFTHVWMPSDSGWSIVARQASILKVE